MGAQTMQVSLLAPPADRTDLKMETTRHGLALIDLEPGEAAVIDHLALPPDDAHFLMRLGFFPGAQIQFCRHAPLGDPSIYSVDGTHIALRAETARLIVVRRIIVQREPSPDAGDLS